MNNHLVFIVLEKAYDTVPHKKLFEVLYQSTINKIYVRSIFNIYKSSECLIKVGKEITKEPFRITKGLRQGCCLSPTLFKIYIQKALKLWCRKCAGMGIEIGNQCIYTLLFADDQVLIAGDEEDISFMTRKLFEEYKKWGLKINFEKSEYLSCGEDAGNLNIEGHQIKVCKEFKYLGSILTQDGKCDREIQHRATKGRTAISKLNAILWSPKIGWKVKLMMYKSIIEPITTYGSESWELTQKNKEKLKAIEMDHLRRSLRISRREHVSNEEIRERAQSQYNIVDRIQERQLLWLGHVLRMGEDRWPKKVMLYQPAGRKRRGRPRTSWYAGVQEAMRARNIEEEEEAWRDRDLWRRRCGKRRQL